MTASICSELIIGRATFSSNMDQKAASICSESGNFHLPFARRNRLPDHGSRSLLLDECAARLLPFRLSDLEVSRWACAIVNPRGSSHRSPLFSKPSRRCLQRIQRQAGRRNRFACAAEALGQRPASPVWERTVLPIAHRWQNRVPGELARADWSYVHTTAPAQEAVR